VDAYAAKQIFISKVIAKAEFENANFSEIEKGMLHFAAT
jgi:hypothetical protein